MFQGCKSPLLYYLDESFLQMFARRWLVAAAVLSAKGKPAFFFGDHRGGVLVFARAGGGDGCIMLWRVVNVSVAFACSAAAGATGGRGAAASSSAASSNVLLAAVMGT